MQKFVVIVAGGSGKRMKSEIPKQFLVLSGKPILMYTLEVFKKEDESTSIILVLPEKEIVSWKESCSKFNFKIDHKIIIGGKERFHSVLNGLNAIDKRDALVAIHDGVRPFVNIDAITKGFKVAEQTGGATLAVDLKDSIRSLKNELSKAEDRSLFRLIQTPQTFKLNLIKEAYSIPFDSSFTDDASVYEARGNTITLVEGNYENIKITTPEDLLFGEAILKSIQNEEI